MPDISEAADLRVQGNEAFASKDWTTAIEKYRRSIDIDGESKDSAKVYSNLAAALCKVSKYDEAHQAAKMAIKVDPYWAKGHWRLGVVLELEKDFMHALKSYEDAVKLAPDEPVFRKAEGKMLKRLGYQGKDLPNGFKIMTPPIVGGGVSTKGVPLYIAWDRLKKATDDLCDVDKGFPNTFNPEEDYIKSEKWIAYGMHKWHSAMTRLLGKMAELPYLHPELAVVQMQLVELADQKEVSMSTEEYDAKWFAITGCPAPKGDELQALFNAVAFLNGEHISCESDGGKFIPSPKWLTWNLPQQLVAISMDIYDETALCMDKLGADDMILSPSVYTNQSTYFGNTDQPQKPSRGKEGSPQEVLDYCKRKLSEGITWDGGMRQFIALIYQGTILHGVQIRMMGQIGEAAKGFKWARNFIALADAEWKVSQWGNYDEKGSFFRKSTQACILSMELITVRTLRGDFPPAELAENEFNLAQEIITIAKDEVMPFGTSYDDWMMDAACRRKPLATACTHLAGTMNTMLRNCNLLVEVMERTGLTDYERDDNLYSFLDEDLTPDLRPTKMLNSLIAETYKHAAIAQLDDADDNTILWWGYAAHISQAGGYKIGDLRRAIDNALDSSQKRDKELFGPDITRGSTYQQQAMMLERYYESKKDDFILPSLDLSPRPDGSIALFVDGQILTMNFDKMMRSESKRFEHKRPDKERRAYMDTSEAEKEHGEHGLDLSKEHLGL